MVEADVPSDDTQSESSDSSIETQPFDADGVALSTAAEAEDPSAPKAMEREAEQPPPDETQRKSIKLRRKNDTFYDDYLHRGSSEYVARDVEVDTPIKDMSYYEYGMHVRVVLGDPWALRQNEFAFEEHHAKFETHVQELRVAPAVPFIHGFTMPTAFKDPETNALFKQLLLRPHRCRGQGCCCRLDATADFCERRKVRRRKYDQHGIPQEDAKGKPLFETVEVLTYVKPWRRFEAEQRCLALAADAKIHAGRKYPVLQDTTAMRCWWLEGSQQGTPVHHHLVPSLLKVLPASLVWKVLR